METLKRNIIESVCREYCVTETELLGSRRYQPLAEARQLAMWLLRRRGLLYVRDIGRIFNRSYPTACYSIELINTRLKFDKQLKQHCENIRQQLNN